MHIVCFLSILTISVLLPEGHGQGTDIIERTQKLGTRIKVDWTVNFREETVTFVVTAETRGFIGFGLSPKGGMNGADVIIGGVLDNGEPYFTDRYATETAEPKIDYHQDWFLISASENSTHTVLHFNRTFDTCDAEDYAFTNDTMKYIWSLGASDTITYHGDQRGTTAVNILDPPMPAFDTSLFEIWDIMVDTPMPPVSTTYWCTIHKSPRFPSQRQIVGFAPHLDSDAALKHNHHFILRQCKFVRGSPEHELLERYSTHPGGLCYDEDGTGIQQFQSMCFDAHYVWAKGGEPVFLPDHVGLPMNDEGLEEYFLLDLHYDNPDLLSGVQYETGVRVYMTPDLRPTEAAIELVTYAIDKTQVVPPNSEGFLYAAHCTSACTQESIREEGVEIFNVLLHSHIAGRKLKLRQFRPQPDGTYVELPWIAYDDNYDFDFQQSRPLREYIKVLPGDHLTIECTYDTSMSTTFGGYGTRDEMCQGVYMYYPTGGMGFCGSFLPYETTLPILGIQEFDPSYVPTTMPPDPVVLLPEEYAGLNYTTVLNTKVEWTPEMRAELQSKVLTSPHKYTCHGFEGRQNPTEDLWTGYPKDFVEYIPPGRNCEATH